jgi:hypothetical protein
LSSYSIAFLNISISFIVFYKPETRIALFVILFYFLCIGIHLCIISYRLKNDLYGNTKTGKVDAWAVSASAAVGMALSKITAGFFTLKGFCIFAFTVFLCVSILFRVGDIDLIRLLFYKKYDSCINDTKHEEIETQE